MIHITINPEELNPTECQHFRERRAVRGIILNDEGRIACLHVKQNHYHKLPGGGIKAGETIEAALDRECLEEIGYKISIISRFGQTIEYRKQHRLVQYSYYFLCEVMGLPQQIHLTQKERAQGFEPIWFSPLDALKKLLEDRPANYAGYFINQRDFIILSAFVKKQHIGHHWKE